MHEIYLKRDLKVIHCIDPSFKDGSYKIKGVTDEIKSHLNKEFNIPITNDDALLPRLGELNYGFQCFHDTDSTEEIVIPHTLKTDYLDYKPYCKYTFEKYEIVSKHLISDNNCIS